MSLKIKQSLILLSIVIIEIVGFNNHWKYDILSFVNPDLEEFFIINLICFKTVIVIIIIVLIRYLLKKLRTIDKEPLFIVYLIKGFQVRGSDIIGILNVIFVLCSIAWIGIEIYYNTFNGFLNASIYAAFMILYALLIANYFLPKQNIGQKPSPKVLITALGLVYEKFLRPSINEMKEESMKAKWLEQVFYNQDGSIRTAGPYPWGPWSNLDPIRKSIIKHKGSFQEIILISSIEATKECDKLPGDIKPQKLISDFLNQFYPHSNTTIRIVADGTTGNNLIENGIGIESIIQSLYLKNFKDIDIMFNITGSTVAISGAMILKAIKGERRAEYARQDEGYIEEIPLSIATIKDLWVDLLEQVG